MSTPPRQPEQPPPERPRRMPGWVVALLITLAVIVVLFGLCVGIVLQP